MPYLSEESNRAMQDAVELISDGVEALRRVTFDPGPTENGSGYESAAPAPLPVTEVAGPAKRPIPWGLQCAALHPDFIDGLLWIESKIGLAPENLVPCMKFESNLNPKARNPKSTASGLIQFMAFTATSLGTTIEHIRSLDAMGQLSFVYKYFANQSQDWSKYDAADVYMAILWPKAMGKPMSYKLWAAGTDAYKVNAGLDIDKDGMVTKEEAAHRVLELQKQGFEDKNVGYF